MTYQTVIACALVCASFATAACAEPEGPAPCCDCFSSFSADLRLPEHPPERFQVVVNGEVLGDDCDPDAVSATAYMSDYPLSEDHTVIVDMAAYSYFDHEFIDLEVYGRDRCREPPRLLAGYYQLETAPDLDRDSLFDGIDDGTQDWCHQADVKLSCVPGEEPADVPFATRMCE